MPPLPGAIHQAVLEVALGHDLPARTGQFPQSVINEIALRILSNATTDLRLAIGVSLHDGSRSDGTADVIRRRFDFHGYQA